MFLDTLAYMLRRAVFPHRPVPTRSIRAFRHYDIGEYTYGFPKVLSWGEGATLRIGKFCSIAEKVVILLGGEHRIDWVTTYPFSVLFPEAAEFHGHPRTKGDVVIGNDVWIGQEALILSGVTIGNGAVIAARSVVSRPVPDYAIVGGNPARVVRYRFPEPQIRALQEIAWWDWPREKIVRYLPLLLSDQVEDFIKAARQLDTTP